MKSVCIVGRLSNGLVREQTIEEYDGEYQVTSRANASYQLETKNKLLVENIEVKEIPYYETSNNSGGVTIYIGKDSEIIYG